MPRRRDDWSFRGAGSLWLLKLSNERVHSGIILKYSDTWVHLRSAGSWADIRVPSLEIQWIRPLISIEVEGWTVMLGFHPDETEFETWWMKGEVIRRIGYSDVDGFAAGDRVLCKFGAPDCPSAKARDVGHVMIHEELQRRRLDASTPGTRQQ